MPNFKHIIAAGLLSLTLVGCQGFPLNSILLPSDGDHYALPLKLSMDQECDGSSQLIYEIKSDGSFRFLSSEGEAVKPTFVTRKLILSDAQALDRLLEKEDLSRVLLQSKEVDADAPQTTECRSIETLTLDHDGEATQYDRNGRRYEYTEAYLDAWKNVRALLDRLAERYRDGQPVEPLPTPTPMTGEYRYALPLRLQLEDECGGNSSLQYEVTADGLFRYQLSPDPYDEAPVASVEERDAYMLDRRELPYQERPLSLTERNDLNVILSELDLARLADASQPVSENAEQTTECRMLQTLSLNVNGSERLMENNGRKYIYSARYHEAFNRLISHLQALTHTVPPPVRAYTYTFPLKVEDLQECGGARYLRYEVSPEGTLTYAQDRPDYYGPDGNQDIHYGKRQLSDSERSELKTLLYDANLALHFERSEPVPPDAPQTEECRSIQEMTLNVDGSPVRYDLNGRKYQHTDLYHSAFKKVTSFLDELSLRVVEPPPPPMEYRYALPVKIEAQQECGGEQYLKYELTPEGRFRYLMAEADFSDPALAYSRAYGEYQLDDAQRAKFQTLIEEVNLAYLFTDAKPVPDGSPMTMECRTVNTMMLQVNGTARRFDENGRAYIHSERYREGFRRIENHLESLRQFSPPVTDKEYTLPLKVTVFGECGLPKSNRFEIDRNGLFTWALEDAQTFAAGNPPMQSRYLSQDERANLLAFLNRTELIARFQRAQPVPADAPQTDDCRSIMQYSLTADGVTQTYEGEGTRKWVLSDYLRSDLDALQTILNDLRS